MKEYEYTEWTYTELNELTKIAQRYAGRFSKNADFLYFYYHLGYVQSLYQYQYSVQQAIIPQYLCSSPEKIH